MANRVKGIKEAGGVFERAGTNVDWLAVAVGNIGTVRQVAEKLGVSRQTLYGWLEEGTARIPFEQIVKISELGDVPIEYLKRRMGPFAHAAEHARG